MKKNSIIIGTGIIIVIGVVVYIFAHKTPVVAPEKPTTQTPQVVAPVPVPPIQTASPAVKTLSIKNNFIATKTQPYPQPKNQIIGSAAYILLEQPIDTDGTMHYFAVFTDPATGKPFSTAQKLYYDPSTYTTIASFGPKATGNVHDLIVTANKNIAQNGYAILSVFFDGGPDYRGYKVVQ